MMCVLLEQNMILSDAEKEMDSSHLKFACQIWRQSTEAHAGLQVGEVGDSQQHCNQLESMFSHLTIASNTGYHRFLILSNYETTLHL